MFARLGEVLVQNRGRVLVILTLATIGAVALVPYARFDFAPEAIYSGDERMAFYEGFQETFGHDDAVLLLVVETAGEADLLDPAALSWQRTTRNRLEALDRVSRVESLTEISIPIAPADNPKTLEKVTVLDAGPVTAQTAGDARRRLAETGWDTGLLLSRDARAGALVIVLTDEGRTRRESYTSVANVQDLLGTLPPPTGYRAFLTGLPVLRRGIVTRLEADQRLLIPLAGVILALAFAILFRRLLGVILPAAAVGIGLAWTTAVMVLMDQSFNIISNTLPILLLVIGTSDCIHILARFSEETHRRSGDRRAAAIETISHLGLACWMTSATTSIGFLSWIVGDNPLLRDFAWQAATGVIILYLSTLLLLGATLPSFRPASARQDFATPGFIERALDRMAYATAHHPLMTFSASLAVILLALFCARDVVVNHHMLDTYDDDHPAVRAVHIAEDKLGGFVPLSVSLRSETPGMFSDPLVYKKIEAFQRFAEERNGVLSSRSFVDLHRQIREALPEDVLPATPRSGLAGKLQIGLMHTRIDAENLPPHQQFVTPAGDHTRIVVRVGDIGNIEMRRLIQDLEDRLAVLFPADSGIASRLTGDAYLSTRSHDGFINTVFYSLLLASFVLLVMISVLFRSIRVGLIAVLPNLTPLALTLGYIGLRGYDLNAGNVVVFTVSLGLAVDSAIHFLNRFVEEVEGPCNVEEAIHRAFRGSGRAIVLTTVVLAGGLAILLFSDFLPTRRFAELTSFTVASALLGDLALLPTCLSLFWKTEPSCADSNA